MNKNLNMLVESMNKLRNFVQIDRFLTPEKVAKRNSCYWRCNIDKRVRKNGSQPKKGDEIE